MAQEGEGMKSQSSNSSNCQKKSRYVVFEKYGKQQKKFFSIFYFFFVVLFF
jgi:hypothetical protein